MRSKQSRRSKSSTTRQDVTSRCKNRTHFLKVLNWFLRDDELFPKHEFHGNTKWCADQLAVQALIWSWQDKKHVTDAFDCTLELCDELAIKDTAKSYTSMMNALDRHRDTLTSGLRERFQTLAEEAGGRHFRTDGWVLIGFDGSRVTAPRSVPNEQSLCAANYGKGTRAKYGRKKSKGMRRKRNQKNPPHPQAPQAWVTMMWHMGLRLPWTWRLGPSTASERDHVKEILREEKFPQNTLFCGDAGFTGYPLWSEIIAAGADFLVRVGSNVNLLSEHSYVKRLGDGIVLCWPKDKMSSGAPPLRLRLVKVNVGKTTMWMLTSILDRKRLNAKRVVRYYQMRWGIEVEFRGLKQTNDKHTLQCRNPNRLLVELDWSIRAMAVAELLAVREQIASQEKVKDSTYEPKHCSLAATMRALRRCLRNLHKYSPAENGLTHHLSRALIQRYNNRTDKRARYRPKNPDKNPLREPKVRKLNNVERTKITQLDAPTAA